MPSLSEKPAIHYVSKLPDSHSLPMLSRSFTEGYAVSWTLTVWAVDGDLYVRIINYHGHVVMPHFYEPAFQRTLEKAVLHYGELLVD